jgi:hypothetical protein
MVAWGTAFLSRTGLAAAVTGLALACSVTFATLPASAETLAAECSNLQAKLDAAVKTSGTDRVILTGLCTGAEARVLLPKNSSITLEGAAGTNSGLDGSAQTGRLIESEERNDAVTLSNLDIEDADGGGGIKLEATSVTLENDLFAGDTAEAAYAIGGGAYVEILPLNGSTCEAGEPAGLTISGASFIGDTAKGSSGPDHGGGLYAVFGCPARAEILSHDTFERDSVAVSSSGEADGGGASFSSGVHASALLHQEGDVFDSDTVAGPAEGNRGGGGEWLEGINMTSVGDRFSRDSIPGTREAGWSWGAGLGILNTNCTGGVVDESTLEDAVIAGNSIGAGTPADLGGAGIYVGVACLPEPAGPSHLRLLDSTVTENTLATAGGTAGIDGHSTDELVLENSIVAANPGGAQIKGFTAPPGALTSAFSDACDEAGTAPLAGEGNICAAPELADAGNPASFDVQETEASPTIDAGSNALVPGGLTADYLGFPRILASVRDAGCSAALGPVGPATVDMGAAEYNGVVPARSAAACPSVRPSLSSFSLPGIAQLARGAVKLTFGSIGAGKLTAAAKFTLTRLVTVEVHGRKVRRRRSEVISLAHATLTISKAGRASLTLTPSKRARALLAAHRREQLRLTITYTAPDELPATKTRTFTDVYRPARPRKHHG